MTYFRLLALYCACWLWTGQSFAQTTAPVPLTISIEQAIQEAIQNNPGLLAERLGVPVAETAVITAGLRPNPVVSASSDHLDWLGTGFSDQNGAG
ncbi:MAG TPA: hypothetical protein VGJ09_05985, partial [Bryobacteraceae bacterium]